MNVINSHIFWSTIKNCIQLILLCTEVLHGSSTVWPGFNDILCQWSSPVHLEMTLADSDVSAVHLETALADGHVLTRCITCVPFIWTLFLFLAAFTFINVWRWKRSDSSSTFSAQVGGHYVTCKLRPWVILSWLAGLQYRHTEFGNDFQNAKSRHCVGNTLHLCIN